MTKAYIISQILAFISFLLGIVAYYASKKEKIMLTVIASNTLNLIHYVLLGATSGYITKIIAIIRDLFIVIKDKKHWSSNIVLIIFVTLYVTMAVFTYENIYSILPLSAALIYTITVRNWNEGIVKKSAFFCYFLRLIYNIIVGSIVAVITTTISIISTFFAIIQYHKKQKKRTSQKIREKR